MPTFDLVIIGSGPAALGVLLGLKEGLSRGASVALVSGKSSRAAVRNYTIRRVHSKVHEEIFEASSWDAICNFIAMNFLGQEYFLFETACRGGLSSFWGQQLLRVAQGDFQPTAAVDTYEKYELACNAIEQQLSLKESDRSEQWALEDGSQVAVRSPRLVEPLNALSVALHTASAGVHFVDQRVIRITKTNAQSFHVTFENSEEVIAKKVILAAGTLGTARILMNSLPSIRHCRFSDHAPYLFHTVSWRNRFFRTLGTNAQNMNFLNIEVFHHGQVQAFASVYDTYRMAANLALGQVGLPMLRVLRGKNLALTLPYYPIQVWTRDSLVEVDLEFAEDKIIAKGRTAGEQDRGLQLARAALRSCGFRKLHHTTTLPGLGFHHHALRVSADGRRYESAEQHVAREFGEGLRIADGSVLARLTPRPHTETLMANAFWTARSILETSVAEPSRLTVDILHQ